MLRKFIYHAHPFIVVISGMGMGLYTEYAFGIIGSIVAALIAGACVYALILAYLIHTQSK